MNGGSPGIQFLSFHRLYICSDHRPLFVGPTVDRTNSLPRPRWANVKQLPAGQKDNSLSEFGSNRSPDAFLSNSIQFQEVTLSENVVIKPNSKGFSLFFTLKCITILHIPCVGSPLCVQRAAGRKPLLAPSMLLYHEQSAAG